MKFAVDGWNPAKPTPIGTENFDVWADLDGNGSLTTRYLHDDAVDALFARIDQSGGTGTGYYYLTDRLGSIREVAAASSGTVLDAISYDGFGRIASETNSSYRGRYAWTGRELDAEIDLQYNRARYYDANTGRWISQDPLGFDAGDGNLYRYVRNKHQSYLDPSGFHFQVIPNYEDLYRQRILEEIERQRSMGHFLSVYLLERYLENNIPNGTTIQITDQDLIDQTKADARPIVRQAVFSALKGQTYDKVVEGADAGSFRGRVRWYPNIYGSVFSELIKLGYGSNAEDRIGDVNNNLFYAYFGAELTVDLKYKNVEEWHRWFCFWTISEWKLYDVEATVTIKDHAVFGTDILRNRIWSYHAAHQLQEVYKYNNFYSELTYTETFGRYKIYKP